ncbi:smc-like protein [Ectocarpus siliculosus]|uniref:Smc-like protein n=1 Tax=Ectocarpus siliculosus TaxID=2880 RepID=D7G4M1_ECTSI|nr:smc-like protein [Ectocarpus siliculosus]|eukprot:CBJ48924.1 smc-like protein [Ectocarpus siliculosus]
MVYVAKEAKVNNTSRSAWKRNTTVERIDIDVVVSIRPPGGVGGEAPRRGVAAVWEAVRLPPPPTDERSQRGKKRKRKTEQPEAGVVLKVHVSNFMCHRKLSVPLCKHVNFINGRNGSGKSAILAALQICLGAKAHLTHRAKKMADFIRHGWKGDAVLEVTLLNTEHGFMFEEYGESITIRRTIKQPSGGGFALLGHDRKVKSTNKAELLRMLEFLNIQVDNPVAVLDQENSKKFILGTEKDKYEFFLKATDLGRISDYIEEAGEYITKMKNGSDAASHQYRRSKDRISALKHEYKAFQELEKLERTMWAIQEHIEWAVVSAAEEKVKKLRLDTTAKTLLRDKLNEKIAEFNKEIADTEARKLEVNARLNAGVAETARLKQVLIKAKEEFRKAESPLRDLRTQRTSLETERKDKMKAKDALSRDLNLAREAAVRAATDGEERLLHEKIQEADHSLAGVGHQQASRGGEEYLFELRRAANQAEEMAHKAKEELQACDKDVRSRQAEANRLQTETFNPLSALGSHMPALVRRISQNADKFHSPPVGPIGASIQLKEEYKGFRVCIEGHLSRHLNNFVVSCHQDRATLMRIIRAFRGNQRWFVPTIIVQTLQPRYRPQSNPPGFLQIMQAINVDNDQAFNSLVDQCSIEKNCLFASKEEAEKACLRGRSGTYERLPYGMYEAYYPSLGGKSCSKFTVSGRNLETRMNVVNSNRHRRVLGVDEGTQKEEAQAQVRQAQSARERAKSGADAAARSLNEARHALREEEGDRKRLQSEVKKQEVEKTRLSNQLMALQAKNNDSSDPTEQLERDLQVATEGVESVEAELATNQRLSEEAASKIEPFERAKAIATKAHKDSGTKSAKLQDELEKIVDAGKKPGHKLSKAAPQVEKVEKELEHLAQTKEEAEKSVETAMDSAKSFMAKSRRQPPWDGRRADDPGKRTVEALRAKLKQAEERYFNDPIKINMGNRTKAMVVEELIQEESTRGDMGWAINKLDSNMKMLSDERLKRREKWKTFRDVIPTWTARMFGDILAEKEAHGEVKFNHKKKTLGLSYQSQAHNDTSKCRDVRQLSGGEKSYATLALLLSLGAHHDCPFRVMDEFDVFMDAVSRDHAILEVLKFAKRNKDKQFIFITPQDLSSVTSSDTCKIIKMQPPRKGDHNQTTLTESFGSSSS